MSQPQTFAEVIARWGKTPVFAEDLGVPDVVARAWKRRGIPGEYWARVAAVAARREYHEITLELLADLGAQVAAERSREAPKTGAAA